MTLGEKIRALRQRSGLSQSQLAQKLHISRAAVAKWENDNGLPDIANMKSLSSYFDIDLDDLLNESHSVSIEPPALEEPPESFCGKSCSNCQFREALNCHGCRQGEGRRYGPCRVAQCCRDRMLSTCRGCSQRNSCEKYRNIPGQQDQKMKDRLAARVKTQKVAPILGKWLGVLFWLVLLNSIVDLFAQDYIGHWMPWLQTTGEIILTITSVAYGIVLVRCAAVTEYYQTAGICQIVCALLAALKLLIPEGSGLIIVVSLIVLPLVLVARYHEYMGHASALEDIDDDLSNSWSVLWKWHIGLRIGIFVSVLFGRLILLLTLLVILALGIYQTILLHRTKELFKHYVA